jgi:TP901 family phage tail tape measure protein
MTNDYGIKIEITSEVENAIAQMKQLQDAIKQVQSIGTNTNAIADMKDLQQRVTQVDAVTKAQLRLLDTETQVSKEREKSINLAASDKHTTEQIKQDKILADQKAKRTKEEIDNEGKLQRQKDASFTADLKHESMIEASDERRAMARSKEFTEEVKQEKMLQSTEDAHRRAEDKHINDQLTAKRKNQVIDLTAAKEQERQTKQQATAAQQQIKAEQDALKAKQKAQETEKTLYDKSINQQKLLTNQQKTLNEQGLLDSGRKALIQEQINKLKNAETSEERAKAIEEAKSLRLTNEQYIARKQLEKSMDGTLQKQKQLKKDTESLLEKTYAISRAQMTFSNLSDKLFTLPSNSLNAFKDWQDKMAAVRRTFSDSTDFNLDETQKQLQKLTSTLTTSLEDVTKIAAIGGQLGVATKSIGNFTSAIAQVADVTGTDITILSEKIARIVNLTNMSTEAGVQSAKTVENAYSKVANAVTQLDLRAVASTEQILSTAEELAPVGKSYGYTTGQILATATAFSSVGVQAENSRSAFLIFNQELSRALSQGGVKLKAFTDITGQTAEAIEQDFGSNSQKVFTNFIDGLGRLQGNTKEITEQLADTGLNARRTGYAFMALASNAEAYTDALKLAEEEIKNSQKLDEQTEQRNKTLAAQLEIMTNNFKNLGEAAMTAGGSGLTSIVTMFNQILQALNRAMNSGGLTSFVSQIVVGVTAVAGTVAKLGSSVLSAINSILIFRLGLKSLGLAGLDFSKGIQGLIVSLRNLVFAEKAATGATGQMALMQQRAGIATTGATVATAGFGATLKTVTIAGRTFNITMKSILATLSVVTAIGVIVAMLVEIATATDEMAKSTKDAFLEAHNMKDALEADTEEYKRTKTALDTFTVGIDSNVDELENQEDALVRVSKKVVAYGESTKKAVADIYTKVATVNDNEFDIEVGTSLQDLINNYNSATFSAKKFWEINSTQGQIKANEYFMEEAGSLLTLSKNSVYAKMNLTQLKTAQDNLNNGSVRTGNLDALRVKEIQEYINALEQFGATDDQVYEGLLKIAEANGLITDSIDEGKSAAANWAEVMYGSSADLVEKMNELKGAIDGVLDTEEQENRLADNLDKIAEIGYKATNSLLTLKEQREVPAEIASAIQYMYEVADNSPASMFTNLFNALVQAEVSGLEGTAVFNTLGDQVIKVAALLNTEYGLHIETTDANGKLLTTQQIAINTRNEIAKALTLNGTINSSLEEQGDLGKVLASIRDSQAQATQRYTNAVNSNTSATKKNTDAAKENLRTIDDYVSDLNKLINAFNDYTFGVDNAWQEVEGAYKNIEDMIKKSATEIEDVTDEVIKKLFGKQQSKDDISSKLIQLKQRIQDAKDEWKDLQATLGQQRAEESTLRYWLKIAQAVGDTAREQKILADLEKNKAEQDATQKSMQNASQNMNTSLTGNTEGSIQNRADILELAKSYAAYISTLADLGTSQADITKEQKKAKDEFMKQAKAIGYNDDELKTYSTLFDQVLIKEKKDTTAKKDLDKALQDVIKKEQDHIIKLKESGASEEVLEQAIKDATVRVMEQARELGYSKDKVDKFGESISKISDLIKVIPPITFEVSTDAAQHAIDVFLLNLKKNAASAGAEAGHNLGTGFAGGAADGIDSIVTRLKEAGGTAAEIAKNMKENMKTSVFDSIRLQLKLTQAEYDRVKADGKNTDSLQAQINSLQKILSGNYSSGTAWTGNMPRNQIAGVVHGQEAVIQAPYAYKFQEEIQMMRQGRSPMQTVSVGVTAAQMEDIANSITNNVVRAIMANKNVVISSDAIASSQAALLRQRSIGFNN